MMIANIELRDGRVRIDLDKPLDISMPISADPNAAKAWYVPPVKIEPVRTEHFVGNVNEGGSVNFNDISFNPHGNGTHTECVGHISTERDSINKNMKRFFFTARVISVSPEITGEDRVITAAAVKGLPERGTEALVIRTLPNTADKLSRQYSDTNPPYITREAIDFINEMGVKHLLVDLPSIDREVDGGVLAAHHCFWNYPDQPDLEKTITEFIYVPDEIPDGFYLLNIQIAPFENDATPSKPILYEILDRDGH